jgi:hypothetical protein
MGVRQNRDIRDITIADRIETGIRNDDGAGFLSDLSSAPR